nr:MAG TPA: hypothetical protein [Herelleviridae sp.]
MLILKKKKSNAQPYGWALLSNKRMSRHWDLKS